MWIENSGIYENMSWTAHGHWFSFFIFQVSDARVLGFKIGESIHVKYYGNDPVSGDIRLSRKVLKLSAASTMGTLRKSITKPTDSTPR